MIGLVVTRSPSRKFDDPLIDPLTEPSAFAFQPERTGTPRGAAFFGGAAFVGGGVLFATGVFLTGAFFFFWDVTLD